MPSPPFFRRGFPWVTWPSDQLPSPLLVPKHPALYLCTCYLIPFPIGWCFPSPSVQPEFRRCPPHVSQPVPFLLAIVECSRLPSQGGSFSCVFSLDTPSHFACRSSCASYSACASLPMYSSFPSPWLCDNPFYCAPSNCIYFCCPSSYWPFPATSPSSQSWYSYNC